MSNDEDDAIVQSDLYEVPRAISRSGKQVRPTEVNEPEGYTCPICDGAVIRLVSKSGNPFFRHQPGGPTCRAEPATHWAAREILRRLIVRKRNGQLSITVRSPCASCGAGKVIDFDFGRYTEVIDEVLDETSISLIDCADVQLMDNGIASAGIAVKTNSAKRAFFREKLPSQWIEIDALAVKGSNALRTALHGQKLSVVLNAISSSTIATCDVCRVKQEREKRKEEEHQRAILRDRERLRQHAFRLATRLTQIESWTIPLPADCPKCNNDLVVGVSRKFYDEAKPLVQDNEGHAWHVGLMRNNQVVLGILIVQTATFDGPANLNGPVPYAIVPLLEDPFESRLGERVLIAKHVHFIKDHKPKCIYCLQQDRIAADKKRHLDALALIDHREKLRVNDLRETEQARQEEAAEMARLKEAADHKARREAELRRKAQKEVSLQRMEAEKAAELERNKYARSPRGQLDSLLKTIGHQMTNLDRAKFFQNYLVIRRKINELNRMDSSADDIAKHAKKVLDRISEAEWVKIQNRERQHQKDAENDRQKNLINNSWKTLIEQLKFWKNEKEWSLAEDAGIDATERLLRQYPLIKPPEMWATLLNGRSGLRYPPDVRADVLSRC